MPDLLSCGPVYTLTQNIGYALPARSVRVRSSAAVETSQDNSTFAAVILTNNEFETAAAFIRTTAATALVSVKVI